MFFKNDKENPQETAARLEKKLWKALEGSSPFVMLGLKGLEDDRTRPMTVQIDGEDENRTIYFFGDKRESLYTDLDRSKGALAAFQSKGHDIFAHIHGNLVIDNDPAVIDRLWNAMIAPWFDGDKNNPNLVLFRFDTAEANVWENEGAEHLIQAAIHFVTGDSEKPNYEDNRADVQL